MKQCLYISIICGDNLFIFLRNIISILSLSITPFDIIIKISEGTNRRHDLPTKKKNEKCGKNVANDTLLDQRQEKSEF